MSLMIGRVENGKPQPYNFTIRDLFGESWRRVKGAKATLLGAFVLILFAGIILSCLTIPLMMAFGGFDPETHQAKGAAALLTNFIIFILTMPLTVGVTFLGVRRSVNLPIKAFSIFKMYRYFLKFLVIGVVLFITQQMILILLGLLTQGILVLCGDQFANIARLINGIIWGFGIVFLFAFIMLMQWFSTLLIREKNFGIGQALCTAWRGYRQHFIKLTWTLFVMDLLVIISVVPVFIGMIWTVPLVSILVGNLYRTIFGIEPRTMTE